MIVDYWTRRLAMLRLFRHLGTGGAVALPSLQRGWKPIGLRKDDLDVGLREMLRDGLLAVSDGGYLATPELRAELERRGPATVADAKTRMELQRRRRWLTLRARKVADRRLGVRS